MAYTPANPLIEVAVNENVESKKGLSTTLPRIIKSKTLLVIIVLACIAYIPLLFTHPGLISIDTKQYLYINPAKYTARVASTWSPNISLGTVTHQNIGYLLPMGPYYTLLAYLKVATWVAQRLWLGSLFFSAGCGVFYLTRTLNLKHSAGLAAGSVYMLSPYVDQYAEHLSAILLPWAGLGWMVALTIKAAKTGSFRYIAGFGLVIALTSSINATSVLYVGIAPALWIPFAIARKEITLRRGVLTAFLIGIVTVLVSLWWAAGLWVEAKYGINILQFTETVPAVASTSSASEVFRGLGYWYYDVSDAYGTILPSSPQYQSIEWLIGLSFLLPVLSMISSIFIKWKEKTYFIALIAIGMALSVGAHPYGNSTPFGNIFGKFMTSSQAGEALRSTDRATPLLILGFALLLGAGLDVLNSKWKWIGLFAGVAVASGAVANQPSLFNGDFVPVTYSRGAIPSYWYQAANYLSQGGNSTRVLQEPGQDFEDYRWGSTIDPVLPGLTNRPTVERRQVPEGSIPAVDLLDAFDNTVQDSILDPRGVSAVARLMSVGDILITADDAYEHYNLPPPKAVASWLTPTPTGLLAPVTFGAPTPNYPTHDLPLWNEQTLSLPPNQPWPAPLTIYPVANARPILRLESPQAPVVLDGGGSGIVAAADSGLLDGNPTVLYSGSYATTAANIIKHVPPNATLVVTDSNRKEERRWSTLRDSIGYTETATEVPSVIDYSQTTFKLFPGTNANSQTVSIQQGATVTASSYGNPVGLTPEDRAYNAFDGQPNTLWITGGFSNPIGQWLDINLDTPVTTNSITLSQPQYILPDRWINEVEFIFNSGKPIFASLNTDSLTKQGQVVTFPSRTFKSVKIIIVGTHNVYAHPQGAVGFAEVGIANRHALEIIRPPVDLLSALGAQSETHRLVYIYTRERVSQFPPRSSPEITMNRIINVPTPRTFSISGNAQLSAVIPDEQIDLLTGRAQSPPGSAAVARSIGRLPGDDGALAAAAFDGNPLTAWEPGIGLGGQLGAWLEVDTPDIHTFNQINLQIVTDGHHSIPTTITISTEQGERTLTLPNKLPVSTPSGVTTVPLNFQALSGRRIRLTVQAIKPAYTDDYYSKMQLALPVAIAEVGIPGIQVPQVPQFMPNVCRSDLVSIDGNPIWVKITGLTSDALSGKLLGVVGCGPDANGVSLAAGTHIMTTSIGQQSGFSLDQIVLDSLPGGGPSPVNGDGTIPPAPTIAPSGSLDIASQHATSIHLTLHTTGSPVWLVLGESQDPGWVATIKETGSNNLLISQKQSSLIDGYANGWLINPPPGNATLNVQLLFKPQQTVNLTLIISGISIAILFLIILGSIFFKQKRKFQYEPCPSFKSPLWSHGKRTPIIVALLLSLTIGAIAGFLYNKHAFIPLFIVSFVAFEVKHLRWVVTLPTVGFSIAGPALIMYNQKYHPVFLGGGWPTSYDSEANLIWLAILFLIAEGFLNAYRDFKVKKSSSTEDFTDTTGANNTSDETPSLTTKLNNSEVELNSKI